MATAELTSESTHEQISEYVDAIIEDRKGEQSAEKGDAQKIAEERDKPVGDMTAEKDTGSDNTAEKEKSEGEETGTQDWLDEDLKAEASAYGIDEKELADFTSREEVERALRIFDKTALEAGRKAMAEGEKDSKGRDEHGRFTKKEPETEAKEGSGYEIKLSKEVYDGELIDEFTRMRDHYEARVSALESKFADADAKAEEQRFDMIVDSIGHADLFGKSGKENAKELQRRQDLFVAVKAQQIGLQQLGREVDLNEVLVNRVARMVFAEELGKKDLKARTRKIAKQSESRMGGSATKAHDSAEPLREQMRRLYKELESAG